MSLLMFEGFDYWTEASDVKGPQFVVGGTGPTWHSGAGRIAGRSMSLSGLLSYFGHVPGTTMADVVVGFGVKFDAFYYTNSWWESTFLRFQRNSWSQGNNTLCSLRLNPDGALQFLSGDTFQSGGTILATTAPGFIARDTWHYIEVRVTWPGNGTDGTYKVDVDGVTVMSGTGNTDHVGMTCPDRLMFAAGRAGDAYFDDMYILSDGSTPVSPPVDMLGPCRVDLYVPTHDGAANVGYAGWQAYFNSGSGYGADQDARLLAAVPQLGHVTDEAYDAQQAFPIANLNSSLASTTIHAAEIRLVAKAARNTNAPYAATVIGCWDVLGNLPTYNVVDVHPTTAYKSYGAISTTDADGNPWSDANTSLGGKSLQLWSVDGGQQYGQTAAVEQMVVQVLRSETHVSSYTYYASCSSSISLASQAGRTNAAAQVWNVYAGNLVALRPRAEQWTPREIEVSAKTTLVMSSMLGTSMTSSYSVAASSGVTFSQMAFSARPIVATAGNVVNFFATTGGGVNAEIPVSASSRVVLAAVVSCYESLSLSVTASNAVVLRPFASEVFSRVIGVASGIVLSPLARRAYSVDVACESTLTLGVSSSQSPTMHYAVGASSGVVLRTAGGSRNASVAANASTRVIVTPASSVDMISRAWHPVSAGTSFTLTASAGSSKNRWVHVAATNAIVVTPAVSARDTSVYASAGNALKLKASAVRHVAGQGQGSSAVTLGVGASAVRDIYVHAESGVGLSSDTGEDLGLVGDAASMVYVDSSASASIGYPGVAVGIRFMASADSYVEMGVQPTLMAAFVPGTMMARRPRISLLDGFSEYPLSFAETSSGVLIAANGIDPMIRWDGMSPSASPAGVSPPPDSPTMIGEGDGGPITGRRFAYQRFVDQFGNHSDLSPVSFACDFGETGVSSLSYQVEPCYDANVARRQILRNLDGVGDLLYVDIDSSQPSESDLISYADDQELSAHEAVAMAYDDDMPAARRFGVPPSHKAVLAHHLGRVFAAVDRPYSRGMAVVTMGSQVVQGIGTAWTGAMKGRGFFVDGATGPHAVAIVDAEYQVMTLQEPYGGPSDNFASYCIRPPYIERRLVYYSEPNQPEAWPAWNAFAVPETGDEITGLMVMKSFLYVIERRNIHAFTFKSDPGRDGFIFPKSNRGCVNDRCWVVVEGNAYMLDEAGIHSFDGENSRQLSSKIHNLFNDPTYPLRVDWSADPLLWHACCDPAAEVIRWFVDFVGKASLTHAICYDYRRDRWWIEEYPEPVTSSANATIGYRRVIAGTTARRVVVLGDGALDGIDAGVSGVLAGVVHSVKSTGITIDPTSDGFPPNLAGAPIVFTSGEARGFRAIICESDTTSLSVVDEMPTLPSPGDTFQIGGVPWKWRGGWLPYLDQETDNARDVAIIFKPTRDEASLGFQLYFDYADEPRNWVATKTIDGISTSAGRPEIVVNTRAVRGYAIQRMQSRRERYSYGDYFVSVELAGVQSAEHTRIFEVQVCGAYREA